MVLTNREHVRLEGGLRPSILIRRISPPNLAGRQGNISTSGCADCDVFVSGYAHGGQGANKSRSMVVIYDVLKIIF